MKLALSMYNARPYFSLKNLGKNVCIIHGEIRYVNLDIVPNREKINIV